MMARFYTYILILIVALLNFSDVAAAKTEKIKLTGTCHEPIKMIIGDTGRTEVISSLPYIVQIAKEDLPIRLKFQSESYLYYDIDVPKKPFDTTGHVYLVKINETAMAIQGMGTTTQAYSPELRINGPQKFREPVKGIDVTRGVNAAPITGAHNDKTFALIMANEEYDMAVNVDNAINDGLAFKEYCLKTLGIPAENLRYVENVSFGKMRKAIKDILDLAGMFDGKANLIVYYAGHGIPDNKTKDAFLMPVDADGTDTEVCIPLSDLYKSIGSQPLNRCVVFIDACFSGAQRGGDMIVAARSVRQRPKESAPEGKTIVFSASSGDEAAFSHKEEKHGLFTYYLLSKLQETNGKARLGALADYLTEKVAFESRRINNVTQTPRVSVSDGIKDKWKSMSLIK